MACESIDDHKDDVTLTRSSYERLVRRDEELSALEAHGVDNWIGYGEAMACLED